MQNGNFGEALEELKAGRKVWREDWNGEGMWLILVHGQHVPLKESSPYEWALNTETQSQSHVTICSHIDMHTAQGEMQPGWLASQADMLANDWCSDRVY